METPPQAGSRWREWFAPNERSGKAGDVLRRGALENWTLAGLGLGGAGYGLVFALSEIGALPYVGAAAAAVGGYKILENEEWQRRMNASWFGKYIFSIPVVGMRQKRLATQEFFKNAFTGEYFKRLVGKGQNQRKNATA